MGNSNDLSVFRQRECVSALTKSFLLLLTQFVLRGLQMMIFAHWSTPDRENAPKGLACMHARQNKLLRATSAILSVNGGAAADINAPHFFFWLLNDGHHTHCTLSLGV